MRSLLHQLFTGFCAEMSSSLFERKAALINHEFNLMGLGRYQKAVWLLCGFGYLLDLMWAQAFGLSEPI